MIGVIYNETVNYITRTEDFRDLMDPNVYDAMVKAIDSGILTEDYKEKYEDLQNAYDELEFDYENLEYVEDELNCCETRLEEVKNKLSVVGEIVKKMLKDIQWGYIEKKEDVIAQLEKISAEVAL